MREKRENRAGENRLVSESARRTWLASRERVMHRNRATDPERGRVGRLLHQASRHGEQIDIAAFRGEAFRRAGRREGPVRLDQGRDQTGVLLLPSSSTTRASLVSIDLAIQYF